MNCPYCDHHETKVSDSRESKDGSFVKRRRECIKCEKRFSTVEKVQKLDLEVVKSDGKIEAFSLPKIKKGLLKACEKRPVTLEQIDNLLDKITEDLKRVETSSIPTQVVGHMVLKNLKELDDISFLKFAIVHNNYSNMGEFVKEIDKLKDYKKVERLMQRQILREK